MAKIISGNAGTSENTYYIGNENDGYITIHANIGGSYLPGLRWNNISLGWEQSDGYTWSAIGGSSTGLYEPYVRNVGGGTGVFTSITATAADNTVFGYNSGYSIDTGTKNTFFGSYSGDAVTGGYGNTGVGYNVLTSITNSYYNTAMGALALDSLLNGGNNNSAFGYEAGGGITTGDTNITIGYFAGKGITTGNNNISMGMNSMAATVVGTGNIGIGDNTLLTLTSGSYNTCIGYNSGANITSQSFGICLGYNSNIVNVASAIAIGNATVVRSIRGVALGYTNIIGYNADDVISIGSSNTVSDNHDRAVIIGNNATSKGADTTLMTNPTYYFGSGTDVDITFYANNADANKPYIQYDATDSVWMYSHNGTDEYQLGTATALYYGTTPILYTSASPSPFSGISVIMDGYFFFDEDTPIPAIGVAPTASHDGNTLQILGQTDYTYTYAGGDINIQSGDGATGGNIVLKAGDTQKGNIIINGSTSTDMQSAKGAIFIENAATVPSGNPINGGYLYIESGVLKYRGSSGTITSIAPA